MFRNNHDQRAKEWFNRKRAQLPAFLALFAMSLSAFAQQPTDKNIAANTNQTEVRLASDADDRYRIGPGDVLDIRILNRPNLSRESLRVEGNGMIRML